MLLKRYGERLEAVTPDFNARAMNEISFRRVGGEPLGADAFERDHEPVREEHLTGETDAPVQKDAEEALLSQLEGAISQLEARLGEDELLVVENRNGVDWPKTRERRKDVVVDGENRFHFHWRIDPPLRLGVYRRRP